MRSSRALLGLARAVRAFAGARPWPDVFAAYLQAEIDQLEDLATTAAKHAANGSVSNGGSLGVVRFRGKVVTDRFRMDMVNEWLKVETAPRPTVFWYALSPSPPPLSPCL